MTELDLTAIIICDDIIRDEGTRKITLVNCFNRVDSSAYPCTHPRLCVYVAVTNGRGDDAGVLKFINDEEQKEIVSVERMLKFEDPRTVAELVYTLRNIPLSCPGDYSFEFWCGEELVGRRSFQARLISGSKG